MDDNKKVLVIFGSGSDSSVYERITKRFDEDEIGYELRVCSAHKTPGILDEILRDSEKKYKLIIAGAGLAAHLPGVIASKTLVPVVGIPCKGAFDGLDAFLSIIQMPGGFPVLCSAIDTIPNSAIQKIINHEFDSVNIVGKIDNKRVISCQNILKEAGVKFQFNTDIIVNTVNIFFFDMDEQDPEDEELTINVPMKSGSTMDDSINLAGKMGKSISVGLNRGENAAIAAVQLLNHDGRYDKVLDDIQNNLRKKVIEDDRRINNKEAA